MTHVERKSGFGMADKLDVVTAEIVCQKRKQRFGKLPKEAKKTLTDDNGPEFGEVDKDLEAATGMLVFRGPCLPFLGKGQQRKLERIAAGFLS